MDIQKASPVPVMIYNFSGASGGVDMDSDLLLELAKEGSNFCGAKLTCSQIGKITRLAGYCDSPEYAKDHPRSFGLKDGQKPFVVLTGEFQGYGGSPRQPIQPIDEAEYAAAMKLPVVVEIMELERSLAEKNVDSADKQAAALQKTISPVDQSVVVTRDIPTSPELESAVIAASSAFETWKTTKLEERLAVGTKFLEEMRKARQELSADLSKQMGRPISHCAIEVDGTITRGRHMINIAKDSLSDSPNKDTDTADHVRFIKKCPVGPVLVISPWNYPYFCQVNAVLPAILAGNSVLLKPSPQTPLCGE
ncbi:hypothetical protein IAT40_000343 [Kwoniella sp. CBS 6097]